MATRTCQVCGHPFSSPPGDPCPLCLSDPSMAEGDASLTRVECLGRDASLEHGSAHARGAPPEARRDLPLDADVVEGKVLRTYGPSQAEGRRDWWRLGSTLLLAGALFPLFLGFWAVLLAWRLALGMVGLRMGGGRGLFGEIVAFHLVGNALRTPDPVPVYDHVVDTGAGLVQVRQEGEFQEGRIFVGNRVRLRGRRRGGAFVVVEGFNETLGTRLSFRESPWRAVFVLLFLLLAGGLAVLVALAPLGRGLG